MLLPDQVPRPGLDLLDDHRADDRARADDFRAGPSPLQSAGASDYFLRYLDRTPYALPLPIFLFRNFFVSLPGELIDSARIDGASDLTIAWRIVMPLSVPAIASYIIFQFLWVWNDLLMSLVYLQDPLLQPLTVGISSMLTFYALDWDLLSAAAFLAMVVPLVIFFSLQRYFVRGLVAGSVKT
jgi:alpha-glucoside transport system permease protein